MSTRPPPPPPPPPPPGRRPRKKVAAPVRTHGRGLSPEKLEAQARMRAARHCQTSMYASIAGLIFLVVPMIPGASLAGAIVAIVFGCMGIAGLNKVGRGPSNLSDVSAYERVSVRTARRARPQATAGIAIGAVVLCLFGGALFMKVQEERKRERSQREFLQHFQERMREHNERLNRGKTIGEDLERELDEIEQEFEGDDR